jgi:hypothetical protein
MNNIIAFSVKGRSIFPHELAIVTEIRPDFLLPATSVQSEDRQALIYSGEDMSPLARLGEAPGVATLGALFDALTGYIRCLLAARDMLLDTSLISSDPERGVFISKDPNQGVKIKTAWGDDAIAGEAEKICRIAGALALKGRVMGAKTSMERVIEIIRTENPSLLHCLTLAESIRRDWNQIVQSA